jgi:hypothetical protein
MTFKNQKLGYFLSPRQCVIIRRMILFVSNTPSGTYSTDVSKASCYLNRLSRELELKKGIQAGSQCFSAKARRSSFTLLTKSKEIWLQCSGLVSDLFCFVLSNASNRGDTCLNVGMVSTSYFALPITSRVYFVS